MTPAALRFYRLADGPRMLTETEQNLLRLGEQEIDAVLDDGKRYGQKGGDGPNAGKTASTYRVVLPDGTYQKKSFTCHEAEAVAGYFRVPGDGKLFIGGIWPSEQAFLDMYGDTRGYTFVKAVKV